MMRYPVPGRLVTPAASRRGDAAKVIIITVCVFAMVMLLLCVGSGFYAYLQFQKNFSRAVVETPADIRQLTTEITDIDIPPQFMPLMGSAIFGMKNVNYVWNPTGKPVSLHNQPSADPLQPMLNLIEIAAVMDDGGRTNYQIQPHQQSVLKHQYTDFEQKTQEFTIRGEKCQFLFVTGRPKAGAFDDEELLMDEAEEEAMNAEEAAATQPAPAATSDPPADATTVVDTPASAVTATEEKPASQTLPAVRTVTGQFPGKSGPTAITIRVPVEGSDEEVLQKIIESIH